VLRKLPPSVPSTAARPPRPATVPPVSEAKPKPTRRVPEATPTAQYGSTPAQAPLLSVLTASHIAQIAASSSLVVASSERRRLAEVAAAASAAQALRALPQAPTARIPSHGPRSARSAIPGLPGLPTATPSGTRAAPNGTMPCADDDDDLDCL
jgi:hypothetical protein